MSKLPALRKSPPLAILLAGAFLMLFSSLGSEAQQRPKGEATDEGPSRAPNGSYVQRGPRGFGGYSLTLSDIWGPAKMPPAPKDFGPHFDFPPEPLNGAPLHDPYPN